MPQTITNLDPRMLESLQEMKRPIPGQSLVNDPESPAPYERAPKNTSLKKTQEFIFSKLIEEETYVPIMTLLDSGEATIMEVTQNLLYAGFRAGQWNPDLMLLLAEPTAYMLMALAERADIDYKITDSDDEIISEDDKEMGTDNADTRLKDVKETIKSKAPSSLNENVIPKDIRDRLDQAPVESLLASRAEETEPQSLLRK